MGKALKNIENSIAEIYYCEISKKLKSGKTTEHTYRNALQNLIESYDEKINAINEPKRIKCGAPDFILLKRNIPIGYLEAKDIGIKLGKVSDSNQLKRYRKSLSNLILTNHLDFIWFVNGEKRLEVSIGKLSRDQKSVKLVDDYESRLNIFFENVLREKIPTIQRSEELATRLASTTLSIKDIILNSFELDKSSWLKSWLKAFQEVMLKHLDEKQFADMFAQTLSYGFFAAKFYETRDVKFSRFSAGRILPKTNPFLRKLFSQFAGNEMPETIDWAVDEIVEILRRTDIDAIKKEFRESSLAKEDPIIHFYENFLEAYDPDLREARGVYYTPDPIVDFMTRSVDKILKKKFKKNGGITNDEVLILDPATGTGSYLKKCIEIIHQSFEGDEGAWNHYIEDVLLDRIFGLEILMAPYSIAHMKLGLQLQESGYKFKKDQRLGVYLTNTLEKSAQKSEELLFEWISDEANAAAGVKNDKPIMVVLGNPPYANNSENKGPWITDLMRGYDSINDEEVESYFMSEGKTLGERNPKNLNDDYVKFIRFAHWRINRTGHGVLAFITNHGFLDNPTFRGMRESLLKDFDELYLLDLHGNVKKRELQDNGKADENVFDIQQGVSINFFIKKDQSAGETKVYKADLYGTRTEKYNFLLKNDYDKVKWEKLSPKAPYFLLSKNFDLEKEEKYNKFMSMKDIFKLSFTGITTHRDHFAICKSKSEMSSRIDDIRLERLTPAEVKAKYSLKESTSFKILRSRALISADKYWKDKLVKCSYRPFLDQYCYLDKSIMDRPRKEVVQHILGRNNISIVTTRQLSVEGFNHAFGVNKAAEKCTVSSKTKEASYMFPLFQFNSSSQQSMLSDAKSSNLSKDIFDITGLKQNSTNESSLFYYIFAILNSEAYRKEYSSFLKIDFPKIPIISDPTVIKDIAKVGKELFQNQLPENSKQDKKVRFPVSDNSTVGKARFDKLLERLYINKTQYFTNISSEIFEYKIGNHQILKKLIDLYKSENVTYELIKEVQKVAYQLKLDLKIRAKIDSTINKHGGLDSLAKLSIPIVEQHDKLIEKIEKAQKSIKKKSRKKKLAS